jgi:hypothetical protein
MTQKTIRIGEAVDLHFSGRYYQFNRSFAMRDVFDALVELITNSDDSYHRLFKNKLRNENGGPILIEYLAGKQASVTIYDRAEGMALQQMKDRLADVGTRRGEQGDRGFMARGAKDCTELGNLLFESIKDDKYSKCELTTKPQFIPLSDCKATAEIRARLHIRRGNGTVVTLKLQRERRLPRFETLLRDLPWHFALRDILAETSATIVLLKNLNKPESGTERSVYRPPAGELVFDEIFDVPDYAGARAKLKIWKSPEPLEDPNERFRHSGFIVKGERAIHECTLFSQEFERDALAQKYFGRLECPYIDKLLHEYDEQRELQVPHPVDNPSLLIDPNRQHGLNRELPFTKALFLVPSERLRALVAAERENERSQKREIANKETQSRLDKLAKHASEFLKQQVEELEELTEGDDVDRTAFRLGTMIFPTYLSVALGEERRLTYYVEASLLDRAKIDHHATAVVDHPAIQVLDPTFEIKPHRTKEDRFLGTFRVRGDSLKDTVMIRATYDNLPEAQAIATVIESRIEQRLFDEPLEFEFRDYKVREGSRRSLELYAKYPEVVAEPTEVILTSSDSASVPIRGSCRLEPVAGTNYAHGTVVVHGRKLYVVQKPPEAGAPIEIELRDEDYESFRARWADHENRPNLLLVSARHKSVSRYLGPAPQFEGQNSPLFRVLLAEIVAESVCRKSLTLESKERTWEFRWADLKEDYLIADDVFAKFQRRMRDFVAVAHAIMLSDQEVKKALD